MGRCVLFAYNVIIDRAAARFYGHSDGAVCFLGNVHAVYGKWQSYDDDAYCGKVWMTASVMRI